MQNLTNKEALANIKNNDYSKWYDQNESTKHLASGRLENEIFEPFISPEFKFSRSDNVFAIGSCFARGLENALLGDKIKVLSVTDKFDQYPLTMKGVTPRGYMNKYNTYSILYEFLWAFEDLNNNGQYFIESRDGRFLDLNTNHTLNESDFSTTLEKRKKLKETMLQVKDCKLLTITLGMIETWYDTQNRIYLNMTPTPAILEKYPGRFEVRILDFNENLENLERLYALLKKNCSSKLNIVITVSPVPIMATFTKRDIVIANMLTKATLRTVADTWASMHPDVHYFPAYEIVMFSDQKTVWQKDRRHVKNEMATYIMEVFKKHYLNNYEGWKNKLDILRTTWIKQKKLLDVEQNNILPNQVAIKQKFIFIGGCARSGTGILTEILGKHKKIVLGKERYNKLCHKETYRLSEKHFEKDRFFNMQEGDTFYMDFNRYHIKWEPQIYKKFDQCIYFGLKYTPIHQIIKELSDNFPGMIIFYIYRSIYDVAESWNKRAEEGNNWPPAKDYTQAVTAWNESLGMTRKAIENHYNIMCINYDDLLHTNKSIAPIFNMLDVNPDRETHKWLKKARREAAKRRRKKGSLSESEKDFVYSNADFLQYQYFNENFNIMKDA